ncbi:MAG: TetR family transcriptional regulator [Aeromicrobium sp.]
MPPYDRAEKTRRIFDAAAAEFAAEGIAGARVDRIAAHADCNKALIYRYWGDKETLFGAVLERRLTDLATTVELRPDDVPAYIGELFDFMTTNPDVLRLVQHEIVHFDLSNIPLRESRTAHYRDKVDAVSAAQGTGTADPALDPRFVVMSLISLVSWFVAAPQITEMVLGQPADVDVSHAYRGHLVEISSRMLTPRAARLS